VGVVVEYGQDHCGTGYSRFVSLETV